MRPNSVEVDLRNFRRTGVLANSRRTSICVPRGHPQGLGFDAALSHVARNTEGPLADEFARVLQEMQIGLGRGAALRALGDRTHVVYALGSTMAYLGDPRSWEIVLRKTF